ncbi:fructosamine kinase family protein [Streptomyces sp. NPDC002734]|uniref:fructosamine kinase family protein n=1 Tax=Streptomyces sp. NPDC002734 TaxID=3154426 RepID=UPI0033268FAB
MSHGNMLRERLREAGFAAGAVEEIPGGVIAVAGVATLRDGGEVFAKTLAGPESDVFEVEAAGLAELRAAGARTPEVLAASSRVLVLERMRPRQDTEEFWERLGRMVAELHTSHVADRFGWHRDGWLGRMRQDNTWDDDGHRFFAERRVLRWLPEPHVEAAFDREDRQAIERFCAALPELVPEQPPCLTHGDLWKGNVVTAPDGAPVLIDPAVSYTWPEVDLSMLWCSLRPPEADRFFAAYRETGAPREGWEGRMRLLHLRELLSHIAHGDDTWGAADEVRKVVRPFRRTDPGGGPRRQEGVDLPS